MNQKRHENPGPGRDTLGPAAPPPRRAPFGAKSGGPALSPITTSRYRLTLAADVFELDEALAFRAGPGADDADQAMMDAFGEHALARRRDGSLAAYARLLPMEPWQAPHRALDRRFRIGILLKTLSLTGREVVELSRLTLADGEEDAFALLWRGALQYARGRGAGFVLAGVPVPKLELEVGGYGDWLPALLSEHGLPEEIHCEPLDAFPWERSDRHALAAPPAPPSPVLRELLARGAALAGPARHPGGGLEFLALAPVDP